MSDRFNRSIVFFDLPTITAADRRNYNRFRKMLIKNGYIMLQESVYCRMITTENMGKSLENLIIQNKPPEGIVQLLRITERQFSKMKYIVGEYQSDIIDSDERIIVL